MRRGKEGERRDSDGGRAKGEGGGERRDGEVTADKYYGEMAINEDDSRW